MNTNPTVRGTFKAWVFTLNNPIIDRLPQDFIEKCEFLTYQLEKSASGTHHFQGYLVLKEKKGLKWLKDNMTPFAHWEPRRGTHDEAVAYCNKEDTREDGPWTHGQWSETEGQSRGGKQSGEKNASKILAIKRKIDEGQSDQDIWQENFGEMLRYSKAFDRYRMTLTNTFRTVQTKGVWFWGPPGTGKSHRARDFALRIDPNPYYLKLTGNNQWFDGMTPGCKCVVVEDFRGNAPISFMLTLLDHTPMNVETKGSMMPFAAEWVVFTSNSHPRDVYGQQSESKIPLDVLNAWSSRFQGARGCIRKMDTLYVDPNVPLPVDEEFDKIERGVLPAIDLTCDEEIPDSQEGVEEWAETWQREHDNDEPDEDEAEGYQAWDEQDKLEAARASGATAWLGEEHLSSQAPAEDGFDERVPRTPRQVHPWIQQPPKVYCDCQDTPCDGAELLKKLRLCRTDGSTLGLEKVKDKRLGLQPVQSKLKFSARRNVIPVDDDNDN